MYTWPLGSGIEATEVENNVTAGSIGDVTYGAGPVSMDYQTVELKGDNNSFVDLRVENTSALWDDGLKYNYCFQMYVYLKSTTSGTLFHFLSDAAAPSNQILDILVFIENGNIIVVYENFASNTYVFDLSTDVWYHMIFERNLNSGKTTILIDRDKGTSIGKTFSGFNSKLTAFPGSVRIGGTFDQSRAPLRGRVACFQIIPGLEPIDLSESCMNYDADCITSAWPLAYISSSSTTTNGVFSVTSVPAGYSTGSSAPAVYYTGYAAGLGYSTGSSATAGHSTGSSASAGYSTGSSLSPVVSTTITTTSPTPPSSTSTYTTVTASTSSSPGCITAYDIKGKHNFSISEHLYSLLMIDETRSIYNVQVLAVST